jgi:hypothetical protein
MASPLTVVRNDYRKNRKRSTVYTPVGIAEFLHRLLRGPRIKRILDPAIGTGRLTDPWLRRPRPARIIGCDTGPRKARCHEYYRGRFEEMSCLPTPDLVLCNPLCCPQHNGFSVAQVIMWSSSFLQPYFSMMLVFCTT